MYTKGETEKQIYKKAFLERWVLKSLLQSSRESANLIGQHTGQFVVDLAVG